MRNLKYILFIIGYYFILGTNALKKKSKQNLLVLYLYADKNKYPDSYTKLQNILKHYHGFNVTVIKIDNYNENKKIKKIKSNEYDIPGDNSYWEFSGWKKGLLFANEIIKKNNLVMDITLFVNDAFLNDPVQDELYYLMRYNVLTLKRLNGKVYGRVDKHKKNEELFGHDVREWIRSNFFAVPYSQASQLDMSYISQSIINEIFDDDFTGEIFKCNNYMNDDFREFLEDWILNKWPRTREFNVENWGFLKYKLIAILNERMLTIDFIKSNLKIVNADELNIFNA